VTVAAHSYLAQDEQAFYADNLRAIERSYLRGRTPQEGSGTGGDEQAWRQARHHITEGITSDGTFLDVGCANGLLMESVVQWCAEKGLDIEPYGIDISSGLVKLARERLPQWADRIWTGNAIDWTPPGGLRFDYVHILLDSVPRPRRADLIRHHLASTVRPDTGRLLVSNYGADPSVGDLVAPDVLPSLGFRPAGHSSGGERPGRPPAPTAWISTTS
jgi:2-polyprenyl-3-methyl-5-hydroxy-6-metoxy-1,4-benzoquinol methylase